MKHKNLLKSIFWLFVGLAIFSNGTHNAAIAGEQIEKEVKGDVNGGDKYKKEAVPAGAKVKSVTVIHGGRVNGIEFGAGEKGSVSFSGRESAPHHTPITLADDEYVVGFRGKYKDAGNDRGWQRIWVITNKKEYGPFGEKDGPKTFEIRADPGSQAVGLHGKTGAVVNSGGLIIENR